MQLVNMDKTLVFITGLMFGILLFYFGDLAIDKTVKERQQKQLDTINAQLKLASDVCPTLANKVLEANK